MANWGLIDAATASGPQDLLAQILAQQQAKEAQDYKRGNEQREIAVKEGGLGVQQQNANTEAGGLTLRNNERTDKLTAKQQEEADFQAAVASAPAWLKPVLQFKRAANVSVDPKDVALSPEGQHTQSLNDEAVKAAAVEAARVRAQNEGFNNSVRLKQTPSYEDLHKPALGSDDPFLTPGPTVQQGAGSAAPKTLLGGFRPVASHEPTGVTPISAQSPSPASSAPTATPTASAPNAQGTETDEAFLATLPQSSRMRVKAISDGTYPIPARGAISDPSLKQDIQRAMRYDPTLDLSTYQMRADTRKKFAAGDAAQQVQNLNTVIAHMQAMDQSVDSLSNFDFPGSSVLNWAKNSLARPAVKNFETDRDRLGSEITNTYEKGGGAEGDRQAARNTFGLNEPKSVQQSAIAESVKLLKGKIDSLENEYRTGMGGKRFSINDLLSPEARSAYDSLVKKYGGSAGADDGPKVGETRTANGETRTWDGSAWVRK